MTKEHIDKFACALQVMDESSTKELREWYGDTAWAYPDIINLHACVAADGRGDQGHRTPSFMIFHKSFVLTFEEAILAVDPTIGAIPWWNMPLDSAPVLNLDGTVKTPAGKYYCPTSHPFGSQNDGPPSGCDPDKYIWSKSYFGEQKGLGPNFEVTTGRWAWRKMPRWADFDHDFWAQTKGVTNECIAEKYFSPLSANKHKMLRKQPQFDANFMPSQDSQTCVRCCDGYTADGRDTDCICNDGDRSEVYMRGPTLDTKTCSPYVTRNPNGRGAGSVSTNNTKNPNAHNDDPTMWPGNKNGRSQQDSLIRYTQHDFDTCANSYNTKNWMEWQNCMEEDLFGTLEGVYCPGDKEMCKQSELEKVYALHSTGHDKTLGEIGDVTTSPADPALFFSYHAYIDKNFMAWQKSMKKNGYWHDPITADLGDDIRNINHFGYPIQMTLDQWRQNVANLVDLTFFKDLVSNSSERQVLRKHVKVSDMEHFTVQLWQDLIGQSSLQWPNKTLSDKWHITGTEKDDDAIAIFEAHAGNVTHLFDVKTAADVYSPDTPSKNFLGPACSSATHVSPPLNFVAAGTDALLASGTAELFFNPIFGANCRQPVFPSPQPGSLTYNLTNGARTYATSGPFIYMTKYRPADFFNRAKSADPTLAWVPGTLLDDIALGGLPFRNLFPTNDGGTFGYRNRDIIELSLPCFDGRSPDNKEKPCAPYIYSMGE